MFLLKDCWKVILWKNLSQVPLLKMMHFALFPKDLDLSSLGSKARREGFAHTSCSLCTSCSVQQRAPMAPSEFPTDWLAADKPFGASLKEVDTARKVFICSASHGPAQWPRRVRAS